jgi:hypothetical protein
MSNPLLEVILTRCKGYHVHLSDAILLRKFHAGRVIPGQARNGGKRVFSDSLLEKYIRHER